MIKILNGKQIKLWDAHTIQSEGIQSVDLMERAATRCVEWLSKRFGIDKKIHIVCGLGNNGGDGMAITRLLYLKNYTVCCYIVQYSEVYSTDFAINKQRLSELGIEAIILHPNHFKDKIKNIQSQDIIVDAIFGSGLNKDLDNWIGELIEALNHINTTIVAIDIPSGLYVDRIENDIHDPVIQADITLTFQAPKLSFLFPQSGKYVGTFHILDIGLDKHYISELQSNVYYVTALSVAQMIRPRNKFANKGSFGHACIVAGGTGKMGAAILSAKACLRSGVGLLTCGIPTYGTSVMQVSVPEAMIADIENQDITHHLQRFDAIAVGPGIGLGYRAQLTLKKIIKSKLPLVLDADALNILSIQKNWWLHIPQNTIITPHVKEFDRMFGKMDSDEYRFRKQIEMAKRQEIYIVLKGAFTSIACPDGSVFFNSTGNAGMATAGSGDTLTGILCGLLAQGYSAKEVCIMGVYIHGLAGDLAAKKWGQEAMIASDITDQLGAALNWIRDSVTT